MRKFIDNIADNCAVSLPRRRGRLLAMTIISAFSVTSMAVAAEGEGLVERSSRSAWHFRVGPVMSPRVRVRVNAPRANLPALPANGATSSGIVQSELDKVKGETGFADRQYADGYVKPNAGTPKDDDGNYLGSGLTWNWGATDVPAQYSGGQMEFRSGMTGWRETSSSSVYSRGGGSNGDRDLLIGVEAMGGWTFYEDKTFEAAIDAGFRFYGTGDLKAESMYGASVTTTRTEYRVVDSYDASGWTDVPVGPHTGPDDALDEPGRVIGAEPDRREEVMNSATSTETYNYYSRAKLNYRIWDLRLGPTFGWKVTDSFTLRGGSYLLLGLVDASLRTDGGGKSSTCGGVFGAAFGVSAQYNFTENLFLMAGVEYDLWARDVTLNAGGASAEIELSDMSISIGLGVEF